MISRPHGAGICALAILLAACAHLAAQVAAPTAVVFTAEDLMRDVTLLAAPEMEGRRTGTAGNEKARAWIRNQFDRAGLAPVGNARDLPFTFERKAQDGEVTKMSGVNIAGLCRGTGAKDDGIMVISAHYDHLGVRDGAIYHGADDNASGTVALLALARQCQRTPWTHDAVFVAFDAEEMGLQGARAFVEAPPVAKARIAVNVNLDMVARGDKGEIYIAGTHHTPALKAVLAPVAAAAPIKVLFGHDSGGGQDDWTTQSDHGAFHRAGIPFVYFGVEDHPDYHKPTDTADKINPTFFYNATSVILNAIAAIDRALPLR